MTEPQDDKDPFEGRVDGLYLVLISLHGLVRGDRMELGKDPDTGGQVKHCCCSRQHLSPCLVSFLIGVAAADGMRDWGGGGVVAKPTPVEMAAVM